MNAGYWRDLHAASDDDLAIVNYPSFPPAFNRLVDRLFARPILASVAGLEPGTAVEIGCGRGRWLRRLRTLGWRAYGCDIAPAGRPGVVADAARLPVRAASVDLAMAITVLQHVPEQERSFAELCRVVRPGGAVLLVELIERGGVAWQGHVQPRTAAWWRERFAEQGLVIEREVPVEYLPLLRLLEWRASRRKTVPAAPAVPSVPAAASSPVALSPAVPAIGPARYVAGTALAWASALLEPLGPLLVPGGASHTLWLLRR